MNATQADSASMSACKAYHPCQHKGSNTYCSTVSKKETEKPRQIQRSLMLLSKGNSKKCHTMPSLKKQDRRSEALHRRVRGKADNANCRAALELRWLLQHSARKLFYDSAEPAPVCSQRVTYERYVFQPKDTQFTASN